MSRIHHLDDGRLQPVRTLNTRKERDRTGLFFAEGLRFVAEALAAQTPIKTIITAPKRLNHPFAQKLLRRAAQRGVPLLEVMPDVFLSHSRAEEPQWIGAVAAQRWEKLAQVSPAAGLCWVALDTIHSPGNLGTIIRTSDAVGAAGLILIGPDVDPYDQACVRATMGAVFSQRFVRATEREFREWKARHGCVLVGTSPHAPDDYRAVEYPAPLLLWMGGERQGLSTAQQAACDRVVRIPIVGRSDSLNVAVATGIMLYEVFRRRGETTSVTPHSESSHCGRTL